MEPIMKDEKEMKERWTRLSTRVESMGRLRRYWVVEYLPYIFVSDCSGGRRWCGGSPLQKYFIPDGLPA